MAHQSRLRTDAFYAFGAGLSFSWWNQLDLSQEQSINGTAGGTWTPSTNIQITGTQGFWFCGPSTTTAPGSITGTAPGWFVHGDSDYIQLAGGHSAAARSIDTSCAGFLDISDGIGNFWYSQQAAGPGAENFNTGGAALVSGARCLVPLDVHDGATLSQVVFSFAVGVTHPNVPAQLPQFRVYKVDAGGNLTPLKTTGALAGGYLAFPTPGSGAAWFAGGAAQSFTYTCDGSVVIDVSTFTYFAEILDEDGANSLCNNIYTICSSAFTTIHDLRPQ